jgi:phytoene synthase
LTAVRSSFAPAFYLLSARRRAALFALHRFCRLADEAVDGDRPAGLGEVRREVDALYGEAEPRQAATAALRPYVAEFGLARRHFDALLGALERDERGEAIRDEEDLVRYCEGVASAPGQLALAIFGATGATRYAWALGIALQCTNILRDARRDWAAGRSYLPRTDLDAVGLDVARLRAAARAAAAPEAVRALLDRQRERVARWFSASEAAYREVAGTVRARLGAARAMERIYRALAAELAHRDPWGARLRAGPAAVARALVVSWAEALFHAR